jgi:hypothetical protein
MSNGWQKLEYSQETRQIHVNAPRPPQTIVRETQEPQEHKAFPWYLLTGLVLGFILGLLYAWLFNPVVYSNTEPATMRADYKDLYRATIAQAYAATGDLARAESRLALLQDEDPVFALGTQAQQMLAVGEAYDARALALLAAALQAEGDSPLPAD